jgi:hypothetical protein
MQINTSLFFYPSCETSLLLRNGAQVHELLVGRASNTHIKYLSLMEQECGYGLGKIPQLEDVSNFLKSK